MTNQSNTPQPLLTDEEIMRSAINASGSLNITRVHEIGGPSRTIMEDAGLLELGRAIESALLSKLRASVADERAAFEASYRERYRVPAHVLSLTYPDVPAAWEWWKRRAALASAPVAGEAVRDAGIAASGDHMRPDLDRGVAGSFTAFTHWVTNRPNDQIYVHSAHEGFLAGAEWCRQQRGGDVIDDMRAAVRFAPSSAYWSERLREFFGPDAREGIDALEKQLREARAALTTQGESRG